jgi:hypothetical protein
MSIMPEPPDGRDPSPDRGVTDAAWNAVAIASIAYHQEVQALTRILDTGRRHGMTVADLCWASGLDAPFVERLLAEAN